MLKNWMMLATDTLSGLWIHLRTTNLKCCSLFWWSDFDSKVELCIIQGNISYFSEDTLSTSLFMFCGMQLYSSVCNCFAVSKSELLTVKGVLIGINFWTWFWFSFYSVSMIKFWFKSWTVHPRLLQLHSVECSCSLVHAIALQFGSLNCWLLKGLHWHQWLWFMYQFL